MKVDYYIVIEKKSEFPPKTMVGFTCKDRAKEHKNLLNKNGGKYKVLKTTVDMGYV